MRPYDPKKSVWVPLENHDFKEGLLESDDGVKAVVQVGHEVNILLQIILWFWDYSLNNSTLLSHTSENKVPYLLLL